MEEENMSKNNIKLLRQKAGLTQRELAAHIGTSTSAIAMYERGERFPNYEILERLADFFNVEIDFLLNRSSFFGDKTEELTLSDLTDDSVRLSDTLDHQTFNRRTRITFIHGLLVLSVGFKVKP